MTKHTHELFSQKAIVFLSSLLLAFLFVVTWYQFSHETKVIINKTIIEDISRLKTIFDTINKECTIISLTHEKNYIDFLTVKEFVGNQVGCLELMQPEKWHGPYLHENPSIQAKLYEIVRTKNGYYIVPGTGVRLANGRVMGKDIIITPQTDLDAWVNEKEGLEYKGKPLAVPITVQNHTPHVDLLVDDE